MKTMLEIREFLDKYYKNGVAVNDIHVIDYFPLYNSYKAKMITETAVKNLNDMLNNMPDWMLENIREKIDTTINGERKRIFSENDPYGEEIW